MSREVVKPSEICAEGRRALDLQNIVSQPFCTYFNDSDILSCKYCSEKTGDLLHNDTVNKCDTELPVEDVVTKLQASEVKSSCTLPVADEKVPEKDIVELPSATVETPVDEPPQLDRPPPVCAGCQSINPEFQCTKCKSARYCSKECQRNCWEDHKTLCESIHKLSKDVAEQKPTIFLSHITASNRNKLVKLIGEICEIEGEISNIKTRVLWDTGAMVSLVSLKWLRKHLPNEVIRDVKELIDEDLNVRTANKTALPFLGWVELTFKLFDRELKVPFLVTENDIE